MEQTTAFLSTYSSDNFANITRLGVFGGMGMMTSAKFHYDTCLLSSRMPERDQLQTVLFSNPDIPDRTTLLLAGRDKELVDILRENVKALLSLNVSHVVMCCFTFHTVIGQLEEELREKVVALPAYAAQILSHYKDKKILILCTKGSATFKLFGEEENIVYPEVEDQAFVHQCIIRLKEGEPISEIVADLKVMLKKYDYDHMVMGCTDLYLISPDLIEAFGEKAIIDPLRVMTYDITNNWKKQIERKK